MKKTLSVVLTSAMAFSMFSAVAFGKTSADFTDLKDLDAATQAKFDAMISAGIFDGVSDTTFGLKDEMNRAQFAKVAALIMGLDVNKDLQTSSFSDVSVSDPANGYALPYIEALKTAGITDGYADGMYNPAGKVTKEQLATFLVRVVGQEDAAQALTGTDATVSGWAQGYVAEALALKLLSNDADGTFGGMSNATRDLLVTGAYEAKQQYVPAGQVSLTEAKATGVQQVTVTFNKPVDTTKAVVSLKKGTVDVAATTVFSTDKKSAVLTLTDVKVSDGTYTATLSGLDAASVAKATATFTAENEKVTKLSFVNASDVVPQVRDLVIQLKAENQYGENATLNGGNYSVFGYSGTVSRNADTGYLELKVDTSNKNTYPTEIGVLPITVSLNQSAVSVSKTFKIGTEQLVSKVELGAATYVNGKTALTSEGDQVTYDITRYDQYGYKVVADALATITPVITPADMNILDKKVVDNQVVVTVAAGKSVDKTSDYTLTYYEGGASATATVSLKAGAVPVKLEFGSYNGVIADGDASAKYIPILAYDTEGNALSTQDIVDNASSINFTVSGATVATGTDVTANGIVKYGENKGKLELSSIQAKERGVVYLYMSIYNANVQTQAQLPLTVVAARTPESVVLSGDEPTTKALVNATTTFKVLVKDQYGETLDTVPAGYEVNVNVDTTNSNVTVNSVAQNVSDNSVTDLKNNLNDKDITFTAASLGKTTVKVALTKGGQEVAPALKRTVEVIDNSDLVYKAKTTSDLFAITTNEIAKTGDFADGSVSKFAKAVDVTITDKSGNTVAVPADLKAVKTAYTSDSNIATVTPDGKVLGQRVGTATVTAVVYKSNGETEDFTYTVNVKADAPTVATLTADSTANYNANESVAQMLNVKAVDNYGTEYKYTDAGVNEIAAYKDFLGVQYIISDVQGNGTVQYDPSTDKITISGSVVEFVVKTIASNGKTTSTLVSF